MWHTHFKGRSLKSGLVGGAILLLAALPVVSGCGGGGGGSRGVVVVPSSGQSAKLSRVSGAVIDQSGSPVVGVQVTLISGEVTVRGARVAANSGSQASVSSDAGGGFAFDLSSAPSRNDRIMLKLSKPGYVDKHKIFRVGMNAIQDGTLFLPVKMRALSQTAATHAEITRIDGTTQIISPETVTDASTGMTVAMTTVNIDDNVRELKFSLPSPGNSNINSIEFTIGGMVSGNRTAARTIGSAGEISCSLYYGDPTDADALETFPGEFLTTDATSGNSAGRIANQAPGAGVAGSLITAGFSQIKLVDSSGAKVESFADGSQVGVMMRVPEGLFNPETGTTLAEGDSVPIFTFDENTGDWKVEHNSDGSVKRGAVLRDSNGLYVPFSTNHLSWFNLDWKGTLCPEGHPQIRAKDRNGAAILKFSAKTAGIQYMGSDMSTDDGVIKLRNAPADAIDWSVIAYTGTGKSNLTEINSCADITLTVSDFSYDSRNISTFCNSEPYPDVTVFVHDYENNIVVATGKTGSKGTTAINIPTGSEFSLVGQSADMCRDRSWTKDTGTNGDLTLSFSNVCCTNTSESIKINSLSPALAKNVSHSASVQGIIGFDGGAKASSLPDLGITLVQGGTTILNRAPASSLGAVSWLDVTRSGGVDYAQGISFNIAKAEHLAAGKTYSFTIHFDTSQIVSSDATPLKIEKYLVSVPGIVSYTSSSITGVFSTIAGDKNQLPVPNAGSDVYSVAGAVVTLNGSQSSDPDGDTLTYSWALVSGANINITNANSAIASITPIIAGDYSFTLTVDDGRGGKMRDITTVTVCSSISCYSDTVCNDNSTYTVDTCVNPGTCEASCENEGDYCTISLAKENYSPGEQMGIIFTGSNAGTVPAECGAKVSPKNDSGTTTWLSFDTAVFVTIQPGVRVSETKYITVPTSWSKTDSPSGSDYSVSPVHRSGAVWDRGDSFNINIKNCDVPVCSTDAACNDGLSYTTDSCVSPGTCSSECAHTCTAACLNDIDCNDDDDYTFDECVDFVECNPAVACSHAQIVCNANADCADSDNSTINYCTDAGTVDSACSMVYRPGLLDNSEDMTCRISSGGAVECWGFGFIPQGSASPLEIDGTDGALSVSVGELNHACALFPGGSVKCMGNNSQGQVGNGSTAFASSPVSVPGITGAIGISVGDSFSCALLSSGTIKCWGTGDNGELGNGTTGQSLTPVSVSGISDAVQISAGYYHACAVLSTGNIECWGMNTSGELGDLSTTDSSIPVNVVNIDNAVMVATGFMHSCALLDDRSIYCWGANSSGQLGNASTSDSIVPVPVQGITSAVSIASGGDTTCALLYNGSVRCWGSNSSGQIGNTSVGAYSSTPVTVSGISGAVEVISGFFHSCAALSDGNTLCWGDNENSQLGNGGTTASSVPVYAAECSADAHCDDGNQLTSGECIDAGDPDAYCKFTTCTPECIADSQCNDNLSYTIDTCVSPNSCASHCTNTCIPACADNADCDDQNDYTFDVCADLVECNPAIACTHANIACNSNADCTDSDNTTITYCTDAGTAEAACASVSRPGLLDNSEVMTCRVTSAGTVECWGAGFISGGSASPLEIDGTSGAVGISTGEENHACALLSGGTVKCLGYNTSGQLGDGSTAFSAAPVSVPGITGAIDVSVGGTYSCALLSSGAIKCWGSGDNGELGNGSTGQSLTPASVSVISDAVQISAGHTHACAVLSGGNISCWGMNSFGQLGNGSTVNASTPVTAAGISGAVMVTAGDSHTCALLDIGTIYCWGANWSGQLGNSSTTNSMTPVQVQGLTLGAVSIGTGGDSTCAVLSSGAVKCWGDNTSGQLGIGSTSAYSSTPASVSGISSAVEVVSGSYHSCAALANGNTLCWGINTSSQLGNGGTTSSNIPVYAAECSEDSHCDNGNPLSTGACISPGEPDAYCQFTTCTPECYAGTCDDSISSTIDTCLNPGTCIAECVSRVEVLQLVAGNNYGCLKDASGAVKCWGDVDDSGTLDYSTPSSIGLSGSVSLLKASKRQACAVMANGDAKCWGYFKYSNGDGTTTSSKTPITVSGITSASNAYPGFVAVLQSNGSFYTWRDNGYGQLGNNTVNTPSYYPVETLVTNGADFVYGTDFGCVLLKDGRVQCWGYGGNSQLGYVGGKIYKGIYYSLIPDYVIGITNAVAIAGGRTHVCVILSGGEVQCWGGGVSGQLGNGGLADSLATVSTGITDAVSIHSHPLSDTTCAVLSGGGVKCWGLNTNGRLGNGTTTLSSVPVDAIGITDAVSMEFGVNFSCSVMSGGGVKCWGLNSSGQLGNGTTANTYQPVDVLGITNAVSVTVGDTFACATFATGGAECWGTNNLGQLGNGSTTNSSSPVILTGY